MAQKIQTLLIDDLDGGEASQTVRFGLDGAEYEIDLSDKHAAALRTPIERHIEHARKVVTSHQPAKTRGASVRTRATRGDTNDVREYLKAMGYPVSDRGRIPNELRQVAPDVIPPRDQWPSLAQATSAPAATFDASVSSESASAERASADEASEPELNVEDAASAAAEKVLSAADLPKTAKANAGGSKYDQEFRDNAVKAAQAGTIAGTARDLGVSEASLRNWIKAAKK